MASDTRLLDGCQERRPWPSHCSAFLVRSLPQTSPFSVPSSPRGLLHHCEPPMTKHTALLSWILCLSIETHVDSLMDSAGSHPASIAPRKDAPAAIIQFLLNLGSPSKLFCIKLAEAPPPRWGSEHGLILCASTRKELGWPPFFPPRLGGSSSSYSSGQQRASLMIIQLSHGAQAIVPIGRTAHKASACSLKLPQAWYRDPPGGGGQNPKQSVSAVREGFLGCLGVQT